MPGGDGTGPAAGQGRGQGRGYGQGGRGGTGRGIGGGTVQGPGGRCRCPNCGHTEPHQLGTPCYHRKCPKCGAPMARA